MPYRDRQNDLDWHSQYYYKNRQRLIEYARQYRIYNKDLLTEFGKRRWQRNKIMMQSYHKRDRLIKIEHYRSYEKMRYIRDRRKRLDCMKNYYDKNKDKILIRCRNYRLRKNIFGMFKK